MSEQLCWDAQRQQWLPGHVNESGQLTLSSRPRDPEPTQASIWLTANIESEDDATGNGITDATFISQLNAIPPVDQLHIWIDCQGGSCRAMTNIMAAILRHPSKQKIGHAVGKVFSAASMVFLMCDVRLMTPHSCLMCHPASAGGDETPRHARAYSEEILAMFALRMPDVDKATIREWMMSGTYFNVAHSLRLGLATGMDLQSTERIGVDATKCNQPLPVKDFAATRAFEKKLAQQEQQSAMRSKPPQDREWEQLEQRHAIRAKGRVPMSLPSMPSALHGRMIAGSADLADVRAVLHAATSAGPTDGRALLRAQQARELLCAAAKLQAFESRRITRAMANPMAYAMG